MRITNLLLPGGAASVRTAQTIPTAMTDEELHPGAIRKAGAAEETALLNGIRRAGQKDPEEDKTFCDAGVNQDPEEDEYLLRCSSELRSRRK